MPAAPDTSITVDCYVFDILMHDLIGHDRAASAFVVYLHLWRWSLAVGEPAVTMSLRDIAAGTGLSKRGVQEALSVLLRRRLMSIARRRITDVPTYTPQRPWRRRVRPLTPAPSSTGRARRATA